MAYISRLEAQNDRIRKDIDRESRRDTADGNFITEGQLWTIWRREVDGTDFKTELDEFQECVSSPDLQRNLDTAIKTISILICIHWHRWEEFAQLFCRLTHSATLDDVQNLDNMLPFTKDALESFLFPDDSFYAQSFFLQQYIFLPLVLEEHQKFKSYAPEYRLPLKDATDVSQDRCRGIIPIRVVKGHFRYARSGELNNTVCINLAAFQVSDLTLNHIAASSSSKKDSQPIRH